MQLACSGNHGAPGDLIARIKVEHNTIALFNVADGRPPDVDLKHAGLYQCEQPVEILDIDKLLAHLVLNAMDARVGEPGGGVFLEKALVADTLRTSHQRQRPVDDVRGHPAPNRPVICGQLLLSNLDVGPIDPVGMAEANSADLDGG